MWAILVWVVFGLVVGLIGKALMAKRHKSSLLTTVLLGIGGALLGGFFGRVIFGFGATMPNSAEDLVLPSFLMTLLFAILGAMILSSIFQITLNNREG